MNMHENHMKAGTGEDSYANNSLVQAFTIAKGIPTVRDALEGLYETMLPKCVMAAELGCASGPNTLMVIPQLMDVTYNTYRKNDIVVPEINVFMNDLHVNDFNTICKSLDSFDRHMKKDREGDVGPYFISITPGSFYNRIFPSNFLHFVHISNGTHLLSQVPKGLVDETGELINKGNICISKTSPPDVIAAYRQQFEEDFTSFLVSRAQEIVVVGRMVVNMLAYNESYCSHDFYFIFDVLNLALKDMAREGLIDETKLDEFEIPMYPPTTEEVMKLIEAEGSFRVHKHEVFTVDWDLPEEATGKNDLIDMKNNYDLNVVAKFVGGIIKAFSEHMMVNQFGENRIEDLFDRVKQLLAMRLHNETVKTFHQVVSLIKN